MNTQHIKLNVPLSFKQVVDIVRQLSAKEKQQLSKVLQEEQCNDEKEIPEEHQRLVMQRFEKVRSNPDRLLDWDKAKKTLKA